MVEFGTNGVVKSTLILEYIKEPDGSIWEPIFYHNDPSINRFASNDSFSTGVVKSPDLFFNFNVCKELTSWEFMYVQKTTSTSATVKYRWKQTKSPFTATYTDVAPGAITRIVTSGYTDGTCGGFYILNSNTYMVIANATSGNWYGATGCYTLYQGGMPGYPNTVITTGSAAAFVRIDNTNLKPVTKIYPKTNILVTNEMIEV